MSRAKDFARELDRLFHRRTDWLRHVLGKPKSGLPPKFTRHHRDKGIERLQDLASDALARKTARKVFAKGVQQRRSWHIGPSKGFFVDERMKSFNEWYRRKVGDKNCLYVFWKGRRCVYVGKTTKGGGRPSSHFVKHWFQGVRRVDVYATRGKRPLPAMECVAIHRFQPTRNKVRAAAQKWTPKCPLCVIRRGIRNELRDIFRFA